jgi:hypothetical protein
MLDKLESIVSEIKEIREKVGKTKWSWYHKIEDSKQWKKIYW